MLENIKQGTDVNKDLKLLDDLVVFFSLDFR
jgi:hypothetical protein